MRVLHAGAIGVVVAVLAAGVALGEEAGLACSTGPCAVADYDGDAIKDFADNCPLNGNANQKDNDKDTPGAVFDLGKPPDPVGQNTGPLRLYPMTPVQTGQTFPTDRAEDVGGDACDLDDDNDGVYDRKKTGKKGPDNCKWIANADQKDSDGDGPGDACDPDFNPPAVVAAALADVKVTRPAARRYDEVGTGVIVRVACTARCDLSGELVIGKAVIGRGGAHLDGAGRTFLVVKIPAASLRNFARKARRLRPLLRVTTLNETKARTVFSARIVLHR